MKKFLYTYTTHLALSEQVTRHTVKLRCQPVQCSFQQSLDEHLLVTPNMRTEETTDLFGNRVINGWTTDSHSAFAYVSSGIVQQTSYAIDDPCPAPFYRYPSALTAPSDAIRTIRIERSSSALADAMQLSSLLYAHMHYCSGSTHAATTAHEAFESGQGVCQDFAHVLIALCRLHSISARYVCGLFVGEGATHAWVEVYDGGRWFGIDPTHNVTIDTGYIKLAHGRDSADCPVARGTFLGTATQQTQVRVSVWEL